MRGRRKTSQVVIPRIVATLKSRYHPQQIILFGSYAWGRVHRDSDIDLLIVKQTSKPFFQRLLNVRRLVSKQRRGYPFDPLVVTRRELQQRLARGDQFFQQIVTQGRVLYGR